ncbi:MAG: hypothetical protein GX241_06850 [Ruminococcaceae bacterium]|nr:hypothetical protein [Oscillospiraceae bacterium]
MKRIIAFTLFCTFLLFTLTFVANVPIQADGVAVYDTANYCNVPAVNPGDPSYSEMVGNQNLYGHNSQHPSYVMAETFALSEDTIVESVELFVYQTGSGITSPFTGVYLTIYDGKPSEGGSIIWGDMSTNILGSTEFTGCYRVAQGVRNTDRPIMKVVADLSTSTSSGAELTAGTYWLAFSIEVPSGHNYPYAIPNILATPETEGTALQYHDGAWDIAKDGNTGVQVSIPLRLMGPGKLSQTAPAAPVVSELKDTSVKLETISGAEYRMGNGAWQASPEFTGLTPNTAYNFYARLAETDTHLASPASVATAATTLKGTQPAPVAPVTPVDTNVAPEKIAQTSDPEFFWSVLALAGVAFVGMTTTRTLARESKEQEI